MNASQPQAIVTTLGTRGDVTPFFAIARRLLARGLQVTVLSNENWRADFLGLGADFMAIAPEDPTQSKRDDFQFFLDNLIPSFHASFGRIAKAARDGAPLVLVHRTNMLGSESAAEALDLPAVKVALQPSAMRSTHRPPWPLTSLGKPVFGVAPGRALVNLLYLAGEACGRYRAQADRFRRSVGLAPMTWFHRRRRRDLTLVLCPEWFAMPQADWPQPCRAVGFAYFDAPRPDAELEGFLASRGAPVVFTPGTGVSDASAFFDCAAAACRRLDLPAVFLSPAAPSRDGDSLVLRRNFADLGSLLPRSRALVHHGGIGTTAQALRAGVAQVVIPGRFDQPDNAARVTELGLGATVVGRRIGPELLASAITSVLNDPQMAARRALAANDICANDGALAVCDAVAAFAGAPRAPTPMQAQRLAGAYGVA
jgi:rhamnosyltransferase subunit B